MLQFLFIHNIKRIHILSYYIAWLVHMLCCKVFLLPSRVMVKKVNCIQYIIQLDHPSMKNTCAEFVRTHFLLSTFSHVCISFLKSTA